MLAGEVSGRGVFGGLVVLARIDGLIWLFIENISVFLSKLLYLNNAGIAITARKDILDTLSRSFLHLQILVQVNKIVSHLNQVLHFAAEDLRGPVVKGRLGLLSWIFLT